MTKQQLESKLRRLRRVREELLQEDVPVPEELEAKIRDVEAKLAEQESG